MARGGRGLTWLQHHLVVGGARCPRDLQVGGAIGGRGREVAELMAPVKVRWVGADHAHPSHTRPQSHAHPSSTHLPL